MRKINFTDETIQSWLSAQESTWRALKKSNAKETYEKRREKLNKYHLLLLDDAITSRYLNIHALTFKASRPVFLAYKAYCEMDVRPIVAIERSTRKHLANIDIDLDTLQPDGEFNIYAPDLELDEPQFHTFMLLATEYTMTSGWVLFRQVHLGNAEEVAQELLKFYDRQYVAHKQYVDTQIEAYHKKGPPQS